MFLVFEIEILNGICVGDELVWLCEVINWIFLIYDFLLLGVGVWFEIDICMCFERKGL